MQLHETLASFSDIIRSYTVLQYDVEGLHSRIKLQVVFFDSSQLYIREIVLGGRQRKYAYHRQDATGQLRIRWDNAAHWPHIATHPHHQHVEDETQVRESDATMLEEVLAAIRTWFRQPSL